MLAYPTFAVRKRLFCPPKGCVSGSPRNSRSIHLFFPQRVLSSLLAPDQNEVIVQRMSDSVDFSTSSTFHRSFPPDESATCATHASTKYVPLKSTNYVDENWGQLRNIGEAEIRRALAVTIHLNVPRCRRKVKLIDHTSGMNDLTSSHFQTFTDRKAIPYTIREKLVLTSDYICGPLPSAECTLLD